MGVPFPGSLVSTVLVPADVGGLRRCGRALGGLHHGQVNCKTSPKEGSLAYGIAYRTGVPVRKRPTPLYPPYDPWHRPTVGS